MYPKLDEDIESRNDVDLGLGADLLAALLVAHQLPKRMSGRVEARMHEPHPHGLRVWANERDAHLLEHCCKLGLLGQEAVSGVHGVGAGGLRARQCHHASSTCTALP